MVATHGLTCVNEFFNTDHSKNISETVIRVPVYVSMYFSDRLSCFVGVRSPYGK